MPDTAGGRGRLLPEPYRIKMVEPIQLLPEIERERAIRAAGLNPFRLRSEDVYIDLLSDSGMTAMSDRQWSALMLGDEAYAGSRSFYRLEAAVQALMGYKFVVPTHQGRGAEHVLFSVLVKPGQYVVGNVHFDTTAAHIQLAGAIGRNLVIDEAFDTTSVHPFKGNIDIAKLDAFLSEHASETALVLMTVTCNSAGGQPVSLANIRETAEVCKRHGVRFFFDAARYAENAWFIQQREEGQRHRSVAEIAREMLSYGEGLTMSSKKDGLVNIGGLIAIRDDEELYKACQAAVVPYEGFPTYGGMAGRDMEALATGLREALGQEYLDHRIGQVQALHRQLQEAGVPVQQPCGGHAVFIDAKRFLPHIPPEQYPGHVLAVELYREAGVRGVEIGSLLFGRDPETGADGVSPAEFLRLTIPRRMYTSAHLQYVGDAVIRLYERREQMRGLRLTYEAPVLRHFTAQLEWL